MKKLTRAKIVQEILTLMDDVEEKEEQTEILLIIQSALELDEDEEPEYEDDEEDEEDDDEEESEEEDIDVIPPTAHDIESVLKGAPKQGMTKNEILDALGYEGVGCQTFVVEFRNFEKSGLIKNVAPRKPGMRKYYVLAKKKACTKCAESGTCEEPPAAE